MLKMRVVAALVSSAEVKSEERPFRWDSGRYNSVPADLAAFVLFFQPAHQWFEVVHHRARGDVFAGRFFRDVAPIFGADFYLLPPDLCQFMIRGSGLRMFI